MGDDIVNRAKGKLFKQSVSVAMASMLIGTLAPTSVAQERRGDDLPPSRQIETNRQNESQGSRVDRNRWDITDEAIESLIFVKLAARPGLGDIDVEVQDGVAELSGKVSSEPKETKALRIASLTMGVRSVRDQLQVDNSLAKQQDRKNVPDAELAQQVARKIAGKIEGAKAGEDWWFEGWRVEGPYNRWSFVVEADDGNITLDGEVPDLDIVRKAVEAARDVSDVHTVDSDLRLDSYYGRYGPYFRNDPYYGYGYPYHPHVLAPHAGTFERRSDNLARGDQQRLR